MCRAPVDGRLTCGQLAGVSRNTLSGAGHKIGHSRRYPTLPNGTTAGTTPPTKRLVLTEPADGPTSPSLPTYLLRHLPKILGATASW